VLPEELEGDLPDTAHGPDPMTFRSAEPRTESR
jgi:hypothetical protein